MVKTLSSHAEHLSLLEKNPHIDKEKLTATITELDLLVDILHSQPGRIGQELRENEFLNSIRQRLSMPAGECPFNLPAYQAWLQKPALEQELHIESWLRVYQHLQSANSLILMLTRSSEHSENVIIQDGFYQRSLDSNHVGQLMRLVFHLKHKIQSILK